jgi:hypothetical protein
LRGLTSSTRLLGRKPHFALVSAAPSEVYLEKALLVHPTIKSCVRLKDKTSAICRKSSGCG